MTRIAIVGSRRFGVGTQPVARALTRYLVSTYLDERSSDRARLCEGYPPDRLCDSLAARSITPPQSVQIPDVPITIVTGDCPSGVDAWAKETAGPQGRIAIHVADWHGDQLTAGPRRNTRVVNDCDWVEAIWDSRSTGALDTIAKAHRAGKLRWVYQVAGKCVGAIPGHRWDHRVEALVREYKRMSRENIYSTSNLAETIRKVLGKVTSRMEW